MRILPLFLALILGTWVIADEIVKNEDGTFTKTKFVYETISSEESVKKEVEELNRRIATYEAIIESCKTKKFELMESFKDYIPEYRAD